MSFTEKVFTLATVIVLSFFSAAVFLFESLAGNPTPPLETYYAGYIAVGVSVLSLIIYLLVSRRTKKEVAVSMQESLDEDKEMILRLVTEIKSTTKDCAELKSKLQIDPNFSLGEIIDLRKRKVHQIYFTEVQNRVVDDTISDLLHRFIMAYTDRLNEIKQDPAKALDRLAMLEEKIAKDSALHPLLLRIKFKPKPEPEVVPLDPFFTEPLDRK